MKNELFKGPKIVANTPQQWADYYENKYHLERKRNQILREVMERMERALSFPSDELQKAWVWEIRKALKAEGEVK